MNERTFFFVFFLLLGCTSGAQEPADGLPSWEEETEDSISALLIKPIRKPERLLRQIIMRLGYDAEKKHEVGLYKVDATFNQDYLVPFSASLLFTAEAGVGLEKVKVEEFSYYGTYELSQRDSGQITGHLLQFATLSPVHAHKALYGYEAMSPLMNAKETLRCYDVTADSIADAKGRTVLRFRFSWKEKQRKDFDWGRYQGHIAGTAYFDSRSLAIRQFKGEAHLPSLKYITHLNYRVIYGRREGQPVVRHISVDGEKEDMQMKATVQAPRPDSTP